MASPNCGAPSPTYLDRVRGTAIDPDDVIVTNGFGQGVALVAARSARTERRRIAVEDPSLDDTQAVIRALGSRARRRPGRRLRAPSWTRSRTLAVDAVVVTAAHQYPTGAVLRRTAGPLWSPGPRDANAVIIEDDYDAEFRFDRQPIGAIQGLDPGPGRSTRARRARSLRPGLRLGWLAVPPNLADAVRQAKKTADQGSPAIEQLAFADFIERGELDHHLRRLRPIYRERRDALLQALARHLPDVRPVGASAGLHVLAWLPDDIDERRALDAAARGRDRAHGRVGPSRRTQAGPAA